MPYFGQELLEMAEEKGPLTDPEYLDALRTNRVLSRDQGIDAILRSENLDALMMPTGDQRQRSI
jgi:amidase